MTHVPSTFRPLHDGWTLKALNPAAAPEELRAALAAGIPATVPGEATLDLLAAGLIDNPFDGDNETRQQWIGDVDWKFSCRFDWNSDDSSERTDLVCYGLDTVATIMLNGRPVCSSQNAHRSYRYDVRELLVDGANELVVSFMSPVRFSDQEEQRRGYYPHTEHHAFNQIRKACYTFGWDWGIDVANAGIWREIGLDCWSGVRVAEVRPLVDVAADGTGILTAHVAIERAGVGAGEAGRVMNLDESRKNLADPVAVHVALSGPDCELEAVAEIPAGRNDTTVTIAVPDAKLWWPVGYGEHPLYDVAVTAAVKDAKESGEGKWTGRVGFRTVEVDTRADEVGRPFQIVVNGVDVHARGYNMIPDDAFPSRVTLADYERAIDDLIGSNSNMVRIWGGGIYESDEFYDLCDEHGVMVWQDFMLACGAFPEDESSRTEIEAEAREQIVRLCPHPSLTVWNGSNENWQAYAEWGGFKQALRDDDLRANEFGYGEKPWGDYYYSELFPRLLAELDPTHVYLPSSPMSFTKYVGANADGDGTMHMWEVWNRQDYRTFRNHVPRFADEFGYQAPPAWSTLTGAVHDEPMDPFGKQMLVHQKASGGNVKLARGMRSHITPGRLSDVAFGGVVNGRPSDGPHSWLLPTDTWPALEDWHWACQLQQAQAMKFGVEYMRSLKPVNAGTLIWQLNDDWPVVSWAAVDFSGHRKPLWYASRSFFAPRLATVQPRVSDEYKATHDWEGTSYGDPAGPDSQAGDQLAVVVLNDTLAPWRGDWTVSRVALADGTVLASQTFAGVVVDANSSLELVLDESVADFANAAGELIVAVPSAAAEAGNDSSGDDVRETDGEARETGTTARETAEAARETVVMPGTPATQVGSDEMPRFARVVYDMAEILDQRLASPDESFEATAVRDGETGHVLLTVTAKSYVRDLFVMADKVDPAATVDSGMASLLPGESLTFVIADTGTADPAAYTAPNVLRSANDLKREW
ncbi:glycoside hydrolase family 2 protein [Bifidobacterium choloepi]|uniref:glycoside hydrolase family 2 protein n=1 Tax=Bifidobacterium choloepi TaxID=2614131 RepID=UPI001E4667A0|nr:glycoside hydrolase family 2 protein [Bifidobacterium choloepi]